MNLDPPKWRPAILAFALGVATLLVSIFVVFKCVFGLGNYFNALPPILATIVFCSLFLLPPIAGGLASRWVFRRFKSEIRYLPRRCRSCGYNLTANTTGRCPECGTQI